MVFWPWKAKARGKVEYQGIPFQVKVHIDLGPALVGVGRHGVPDTPFGQFGKPHDQLAALYTLAFIALKPSLPRKLILSKAMASPQSIRKPARPRPTPNNGKSQAMPRIRWPTMIRLNPTR